LAALASLAGEGACVAALASGFLTGGGVVKAYPKALKLPYSSEAVKNLPPCPGRFEETGRLVAQEAARLWAGAAVPPLLSSFEIDALRAAKAAEPALPRAFLCEEIPANWRDILAELDGVALHCDHKALTETLARDIKAAGYQLLCYTVNDPADAGRLLAWGVDSLCTDRLDLLPAR
ncbi:glycerophosphodiester phosphodiesterase family protein, partial [Chromobacterium phragmitis]